MKIRYQFVNETVEIEVPDEWGDVLIDLDRQEFNNNQTETRRHVSMDMMAEKNGFLLAAKREEALDAMVKDESLSELLSTLTPQQRTLLRRVYLEGTTISDIAREEGVLKQAIHARIRRAISKILVNRR